MPNYKAFGSTTNDYTINMRRLFKIRASTILEPLISTTIGVILCGWALHYMLMITKVYYQMHRQFQLQNAKLIARYYISKDLAAMTIPPTSCQVGSKDCATTIQQINTRHLKPLSDVLLLKTTSENVVYYLRKSAIQQCNHNICYALYRDNIQQNAVALVENISDLQIQMRPEIHPRYVAEIKLTFAQHDELRIIWRFRADN